MKVTLTIKGKERNGEIFEFSKPGSLLFGRSKKAQCRMKDNYVSRNHFLLIIDPSDVRLRNLSNTNGTEVDGVLYTQAKQGEDTSEAQTIVKGDDADEPAEAILHDGSQIECGYTRIAVAITDDALQKDDGRAAAVDSSPDVFCGQCGKEIPGHESEAARCHGYFVCPECRAQRFKAEQPIGGRSPRRGPPSPRRRQSPILDHMRRDLDRRIAELARHKRIANPLDHVPKIPGYTIEELIAIGGMGVLFKAVSDSENRTVALKIIKPECRISPEARGRFKREINIARQLKHDHIVDCFDDGEVNGLLWMVMEYIGGGDVDKHTKICGGKIPQREAVTLILQALEALSFALAQKDIVHRDIKPPNILLAATGSGYSAKLSDFGLAKSLEDAGLNGSVVTRPRACMGTIPFMPPEQVIDVRTATRTADVFSMGATLYYMLTGKAVRNFSGRQNEVLRQVVEDRVIPVEKRDSSIPADLASVVNKSLELEPKDRFPDAAAFREALRGISQ